MRTYIFLALVTAMVMTPFLSVEANSHTSAVRLTDDTALYTITYEFQAGNNPYLLHILTENGLPYDSDSSKVGYTALQKSLMVPTGYTSTGVVLSELPIVNGKYRIEPLKKGSVTLVVVLTKTTPGTADVGLQITNIPYTNGGRRDVVDEADLKHFSTKSVTLSK